MDFGQYLGSAILVADFTHVFALVDLSAINESWAKAADKLCPAPYLKRAVLDRRLVKTLGASVEVAFRTINVRRHAQSDFDLGFGRLLSHAQCW